MHMIMDLIMFMISTRSGPDYVQQYLPSIVTALSCTAERFWFSCQTGKSLLAADTQIKKDLLP